MINNRTPVILVSMREDFYHNNTEKRLGIDQKLIEWILTLNFIPILVSSQKTFVNFENQNTNKISGIILSGGNDIDPKSTRFKIEKKLLNLSLRKKIPVLGICHGMQFLNYVDGGKLKKVSNHVRKYTLLKDQRKIYPKKVKCYHNLTISKLGKNYDILATSQEGYIEAILHKKKKWLGWMWHPEREKKFNKKLIKIAKNFFNYK